MTLMNPNGTRMMHWIVRTALGVIAAVAIHAISISTVVAQTATLQQRLESQMVQQLANDAMRFGDPVRGALAFYEPTMNCAKCHEPGERGRRLGPDLFAKRHVDPEFLVQSILRPSAEINQNFKTAVVEMQDGRIVSGVLVVETPGKLVIDQIEQADEPLVINKNEIEDWRIGKKSSMPEQLVNQLVDRGQFLDLVRYLKEVADEGPARAASLRPAGAMVSVPLPEYESRIDHAGLVENLNDESFNRGAELYRLRCASCHGTIDSEGSMPTSLRFATGKFKHGTDPLTMYRTLTHGYGMMNAQRWMVPRQKYDVIHYIREHFLQDRNPGQYFAITDKYVQSLPEGDTRGPRPSMRRPWSDMDYGPSFNNTIEIWDDGSNIAQKGIVIRLDDGPGGVESGKYWMMYEHDTLRLAGAWSGQFIDYNGIHFNGVHNRHPRVTGSVHVANPTGPGYGRPADASFVDNRVLGRDNRRYGPLDRNWGRFQGMYRFGDQTILKYSVGKTQVLESPQLEFSSERPVFVRTLNFSPRDHDIWIQVDQRKGSALQARSDDGATVVVAAPGLMDQAIPQATKAKQPILDGRSFFQGRMPLDLSQDFSMVADIRTRKDGTIVAHTRNQEEWIANGQTFFIRDGRLAFDIGWIGVVRGRRHVADGQWHQVAVSWDSSTQRVSLFVDGKPDGRGGKLSVTEPLAEAVCRIGFTNNNFPEPSFFEGQIKQVCFHQKNLGAEQIAANPQPMATWNPIPRGATRQDGPAVAKFKYLPAEEMAKGASSGLVASITPAAAAEWRWSDDGNLRLKIPAGNEPLKIDIRMSTAENQRQLQGLVAELSTVAGDVLDLSKFTNGGPRNWPEILETQWQPGDDNGPFAVDVLPRPTDNPWSDRLRLTGIDFVPGQRQAIVSSWDGSIWRLEGIAPEGSPGNGKVTWQRIAAGLFQPLGVKVVDGDIFVTCRDQIVRLHDLNGDGEADWYENFNSDHQVTEHFHEFAMGLQTDPEGNFYYAKSARHALPALVPHHGTLLKVSTDGQTTEIVANGFRAANGVCINPDGTFIVTDQEGHWNPKNRINWVRPGGFYGNMFGYHDVTDSSDEAMDQPLCWITNSFDRSPAELLWVPDGHWGPLQGSLLNFSYGYGQVYVVPHEEVEGQMQGGMCAFPLPRFPTGVMRGRFGSDGNLYCCGMFAWAGDQQQPGGMYRLRYTGQPMHLPTGLQARQQQLELTLTDAVSEASAGDPGNYSIRTWSLKRTRNYGSDHYDERRLSVDSVKLSPDGRKITLQLPELEPTWCMEIVYSLDSPDGTPVRGKIHNTIHRLPPADH